MRNFSLWCFKSASYRMWWKSIAYNTGMSLLNNHTEITQMAECPSRNGKVSGSINSSVAFSHYWFKNYSAFYLTSSITHWILFFSSYYSLAYQRLYFQKYFLHPSNKPINTELWVYLFYFLTYFEAYGFNSFVIYNSK